MSNILEMLLMNRKWLNCMLVSLCLAVALWPEYGDAKQNTGGGGDLSALRLTDLGTLTRAEGESFQGLAISGNTLVSLSNKGIATLYSIMQDGTAKRGITFHLASYGGHNHANVASFGRERYSKGDALPLLYISQCKQSKGEGTTDVCYVERITPEGQATAVQTIILDNHDKYYGNAVQWVVDKRRKMLVGFGNTINNYDKANKFRIMTFRLPKINQGRTVVLGEKDIVENYLIQDYDATFPSVQIGQGATIVGHCLVMPTGVGTEQYPSVIYSWDLKRHRMVSVRNMQDKVPYEFEDCDLYDGRLYIQCNKGASGKLLLLGAEKDTKR